MWPCLIKGQQSVRRARSWRISLAASVLVPEMEVGDTFTLLYCASLFLPPRRVQRCLQPTLNGLPVLLFALTSQSPAGKRRLVSVGVFQMALQPTQAVALQFHQTRVTTLSGRCLLCETGGGPECCGERAHMMRAHR